LTRVALGEEVGRGLRGTIHSHKNSKITQFLHDIFGRKPPKVEVSEFFLFQGLFMVGV